MAKRFRQRPCIDRQSTLSRAHRLLRLVQGYSRETPRSTLVFAINKEEYERVSAQLKNYGAMLAVDSSIHAYRCPFPGAR